MQAIRQLGPSVLFAVISLLLTIGILSTALAEKQIDQSPPAETAGNLPVSTPTEAPSQMLPTPGLLPSATVSTSPIQNATIPAPTSTLIYDPTTIAGSTLTLIPCGAPAGWISYTVRSGDNLFRLGLAYRIPVPELQNANCLGYSTQIIVGEKLFVPNVPTSTPAITNTLTPTTTQTPTSTSTITATTLPSTSTATSTATATATLALPTETPTPTDTATATSTPTFTDTPSSTP